MSIHFRTATPEDWSAVEALLQDAKLPLDGARAHFQNFTLAFQGEGLVGCAGYERYGEVGLLRSVAVREALRGSGLGKQLTEQVLSAARTNGVTQMVLLTETAINFFPRFGFKQIERGNVPLPALASLEFTTACPDTAAAMLLSFEV
jgi:amino-acid N-acetyltransferase